MGIKLQHDFESNDLLIGTMDVRNGVLLVEYEAFRIMKWLKWSGDISHSYKC